MVKPVVDQPVKPPRPNSPSIWQLGRGLFKPGDGLHRKTRPPRYRQLISPNGRTNFFQAGTKRFLWRDLYHRLLTISWWKFHGVVFGLYFGTNFLFAIAYWLGGDCIANAEPGSLLDKFFFSVQTMATIGYGAMYPKTLYANLLVALEAPVGLLGVAMATGLMYGRFSRPTARVMFSKVALIAPYDGKPMLMFRAANKRGNQILEARLWVTLLRTEKTIEGYTMRRIHDLELVRSHSPFFMLTWTALHEINEQSPFYGETPESLAESDSDILITLTGIDDTVAQQIHARHSYAVSDLLWNHRYVDVSHALPNGDRVIDYTHFHSVVSLDE
jgi:inward rectifier potassium channel